MFVSAVPDVELNAPVFRSFPMSITVKENETAVFTCELEKETESGTYGFHVTTNDVLCLFCHVLVEWLKEGKALNESGKAQMKKATGGRNYELRISNCAATDTGQYSVKVEGKAGGL